MWWQQEAAIYCNYCRVSQWNEFLLRPPHRGAVYCDDRVCLCVCLSVCEHISGNTHLIFTKFFVHVTFGRGSVLRWWRCDMHISQDRWTWLPSWLKRSTRVQSWTWLCCKWRVGMPVAREWIYTHWPSFRAPQSWPARPQWVCWIFMTSCLHIMSLHI